MGVVRRPNGRKAVMEKAWRGSGTLCVGRGRPQLIAPERNLMMKVGNGVVERFVEAEAKEIRLNSWPPRAKGHANFGFSAGFYRKAAFEQAGVILCR